MEIPFSPKTGYDKTNNQPYSLDIQLNEELLNRWWMTEQASLRCTCEDFHTNQTCRHTKEKQPEFLRWKRSALQRLRSDLCQGHQIQTIANKLSTRLGFPLELAQFIVLAEGQIAVQFDQGRSGRYAAGCGWGTMGANVYLARNPEESAVFYLISLELGFEQILPGDLAKILLSPAPTLPPSLFKDTAASAKTSKTGLYGGQGGIVQLVETTPSFRSRMDTPGNAWAQYWTRLCGLTLIGKGWSNVHRYLPGGDLDGQPVAGLALDLTNRRLKGVSPEQLSAASAGVPEDYRGQIAHVHLPWGVDAEFVPEAMVIVKHPARMKIAPDDDLEILTTNLWQTSTCPESAAVRNLLEATAAYLVRMGHNPDAMLSHGEWSLPVGRLAEKGEDRAMEDFPHWDLTNQGLIALREIVVPALLRKEPVPVMNGDFGPGWALFQPPVEAGN